jgi:hypothetical protein
LESDGLVVFLDVDLPTPETGVGDFRLVAMDLRTKAQAALREALELGGRIEYPPVIWRSSSLLAELARRSEERSEAEQEATRTRSLIDRLVPSLPEEELQRGLRALGERLVVDPLGAYG